MTEEAWLAATDPRSLLEFAQNGFLWHHGSHRKLRLFACACCWRVKHLLRGEQSLRSIEVAERHADGRATDDELGEATERLSIVAPRDRPYPNAPAYYSTWDHAPDAADSVALSAVEAVQFAGGGAEGERRAQLSTLRDIFGNPFRPVAFDPRWRTETAVAVAAGIYDGRNFDRLPILADALEDTGCDAVELLAHLRGPGPHARGCWAVDVVLGKE